MEMKFQLMFLVGMLVGLLAPAFSSEQPADNANTVCTEWIDPFWEFLTLKEARDAEITDFNRLFNLMDNSGDGQVSCADFVDLWRAVTTMTVADCEAAFHLWVDLGDTDTSYLYSDDMDNVFQYYDTSGNSLVSKDEYTITWEEDLHTLPDKGCPISYTFDDLQDVTAVIQRLLSYRNRSPSNQ